MFESEAYGAVKRDGKLFDNPVRIDHISVRVDEVDRPYESLAESGIEFFQKPTTDAAWGLRMAGTRNTSGNIFYFITYVYAITETGRNGTRCHRTEQGRRPVRLISGRDSSSTPAVRSPPHDVSRYPLSVPSTRPKVERWLR